MYYLFPLARKMAELMVLKTRLYACTGSEDFVYEGTQAFRHLAESLGLDFTYEEGPGEHNGIRRFDDPQDAKMAGGAAASRVIYHETRNHQTWHDRFDMVETTPVVYKGKLYRFEYVRPNYWDNSSGDSYFRFVDPATGQLSPSFARGYHLGNVLVEGEMLYVTGTNIWDGERVDIFYSQDMERWQVWNALNLPGYGIFATPRFARQRTGLS